ncbi:MAG: MBL fold metallo-hydrolase [Candidatus Asgardarchaeia archaeon]
MRVWFFGGVNEIGGSKFLVEYKDTRFFLDFGRSYSKERAFYSFPDTPKTVDELKDIYAVPHEVSDNLLLKGLYSTLSSPDWDIDKESIPPVSAVFISHAHTDHYQYVSLLNRRIPIYIGACGKNIVLARKITERNTLISNLSHLLFREFRSYDKIRMDDITVIPIHVDHSIPSAYGFIVETPEHVLVYTGDFRRHGFKSELTDDFVDYIVDHYDKVDAMLCEGTHILESYFEKENDVKDKIENVVLRSKRLIIGDFSDTDFDRFRTYYSVAESSNRELVVTLKQAVILLAMNCCIGLEQPNILELESIRILIPNKKRYSTWEKKFLSFFSGESPIEMLPSDIDSLKDKVSSSFRLNLNSEKVVTYNDIANNPSEYILVSSFHSFSDLWQIRPPGGSIYILSTSEPFNEERELQYDRLLNWISFFGIPLIKAHTSGHATPIDIKEIINKINPKVIIPVHTEHPEMFSNMFKGSRIKVVLPQLGNYFDLSQLK